MFSLLTQHLLRIPWLGCFIYLCVCVGGGVELADQKTELRGLVHGRHVPSINFTCCIYIRASQLVARGALASGARHGKRQKKNDNNHNYNNNWLISLVI